MTQKQVFVRDIKDGDSVSGPFLVKFSAVANGKNGKPYMNLVLTDKTGELESRIWDNVSQYAGQAVRDSFVWIDGRCQTFQNRRQLVVKDLRVLREDEIDAADFIAQSEQSPELLHQRLLAYVATMKDPYYRALAEAILRDDADIVDRMKRAPAAKSIHHAYRGGLIEHVVSITGILDHLAEHYQPHLDRDLLFLGGFLHDIGKIWELSYEKTTDYTTEGRLIGHHVMGVELVERKVRELESVEGRLPGRFPEEKKLLVKHLIIAHHGKLEYGSPKEPACLEALVVHMIDDLDSKVNAIHTFITQDQTPGRWTALNRLYERYFYKPESPQGN